MNKLFDIAPEVLIGVAVDVVVSRESSFLARLGVTDVMMQLFLLGALTLFIWVCESLFEYLYSLAWRNLAQSIQHELRVDAYRHIQNLDLAYFEDKSTGGLLSILNDDVNQLERFLDGGANALIQVFTSVVVIGAIFFVIAPKVAAFALIPMPFILYGAFRFQALLAPRYANVRDAVGSLGARLANNLTGVATIKSYVTEDHEIARVSADSEAYRMANAEAIRASSAFIPIIRMAILAGFLMTLVYGGWLTVNGGLAVGSYSVLVFLTQRLLWPLTGLAQTVDLYERAMASTHRVLDLVDTPIHVQGEGRTLPLSQVKGALTFENVSFGYASRANVLTHLSLHIPAGETWAFVGSTGSGKSTLVKLLLRFYTPNAGRILLDGVSTDEFNIRDLRRAIGLVSQDVFLIQGTVRENIGYGSPSVSDAAIQEAARVAEAHEFIESLPQGYDTVVGERGQKLSGGQRQRISIARAVLKAPPILVLDEATSAVDNETESAIQRSLERIVLGRTTILIAHRLSTVRNAHRICVLEKGGILESGTHEELLLKGGVYAALWKVQTGERV
jgi:ATP-binding cassette subfamily B protein